MIAPESASAIASYNPTSITLPPVAQPTYVVGYERVTYGRDSLDEQPERLTAQYLGPQGEAQRIRLIDESGATRFEYASRGDWWWYSDEWRAANGDAGGNNFTSGDLNDIFPLEAGNVAMVEYNGWSPDGSTYGGPRVCGVRGAESITTPSGTYRSMRVECRSGGDDVEGILTNPYRVHVMWISPDTGDVVAYVDQADNSLRRTWYVGS
ncbi:MAG: hypothetical protein AAF414_11705 [Pseudomonadota bacterium]